MVLLIIFIGGLLLSMLPSTTYYGIAIFLLSIFVGLGLIVGILKRFNVWM
jgi:hypothetical protein